MFILRYGFAYVENLQEGGITKIQKHVLRYQQLFAMLGIKNTLDKGIKRGVIWHTQGSGKTALAFHCVKFLTDYYQRQNYSTQFYFIVDRLELLQQAVDEFGKRGLEVNAVGSQKDFVDIIQRSGSVGISLSDESIGAMIVCDSAEQAQAVCDKLIAQGKFYVELVLSTVGYSDKELSDKRTNFKRGNVDILVVFQMLLTGFDAPRLKNFTSDAKSKSIIYCKH